MGLLLSARCNDCDYTEEELRLGGSHAQIGAHDVSAYELFSVTCCQQVQSILVFLGNVTHGDYRERWTILVDPVLHQLVNFLVVYQSSLDAPRLGRLVVKQQHVSLA